ncbi:MAG: prepilin-type N-terminal cleavage/methylation domain-containing protein [Polyangia bacterium]
MRLTTQKSRGFTLIELMIVVAILAVLAAVAIVSYNQYIKRSKNSEATSILADVRLKQESYRATFHQFADVSSNNGWMPDATPSSQARQWKSSDDALLRNWNQLGVTPDHGVYFSYWCEAGAPGEAPANFSGLGIEDENDFWFAARAMQDLDEDGDCAGFEVYTGLAKIVDLEEGEVACP